MLKLIFNKRNVNVYIIFMSEYIRRLNIGTKVQLKQQAW
jgi:hypothetical protein